MIIKDEKILRQVSQDIKLDEFDDIFSKLETEIKKHKIAVGLSAIQIGIPKRAFIMYDQVHPERILRIANPRIIGYCSERRVSSIEGCLSFPNMQCEVTRYEEVEVEDDINGHTIVYDLESRVFQHENDHTLGVLFFDRGRIVKQEIRRKITQGRNDSCACGSGLKYKHCCLLKN